MPTLVWLSGWLSGLNDCKNSAVSSPSLIAWLPTVGSQHGMTLTPVTALHFTAGIGMGSSGILR